MGADRINTSGTFTISRDNIEKFLDKYYKNEDVTIREIFASFGWKAASTPKSNGVTEISRISSIEFITDKELEVFKILAPYVNAGSFIVFEIIYGGKASYKKWSFEDGKLVFYNGEVDIKWVKDEKKA